MKQRIANLVNKLHGRTIVGSLTTLNLHLIRFSIKFLIFLNQFHANVL